MHLHGKKRLGIRFGVFSAKEHFCIVPHPWQPATSAWDDNTVEI